MEDKNEIKKAMRLDKFLTEMNILSRSQAREAAKKGRILVNGEAEKKADRKIFPGQDKITVDGKAIAYAEYEYYMLYKPQGVVSATEDSRYPTVVDLIHGPSSLVSQKTCGQGILCSYPGNAAGKWERAVF